MNMYDRMMMMMLHAAPLFITMTDPVFSKSFNCEKANIIILSTYYP